MRKCVVPLLLSFSIGLRAQDCNEVIAAKIQQYFLNVYPKPDSLAAVNCSLIKQRLSEGEVFLDFFSTTLNNAPVFFVTIVSWNAAPVTEVIPQLSTKEASSADTGTRASFKGGARATGYQQYPHLLQYFDRYIRNAKTIYYSSTGDLNLVNFKHLRDQQNVPLFQRALMIRLHSAASFLRGKKQLMLPARLNVLLAGNIDYNCDTTANHSGMFTNTWNYLPGTKLEIGEIQSILAKKHGVQRLDSCDVTEYRLQQAINQQHYDVVHIATHGFHVEGVEPLLGVKQNTFPLDKSGIVLSGANNKYASVAAFNAFGLLTASDMLKMKLSNVGLIVLSTCHSGEGTSTQSGAPIGLVLSLLRQGSTAMIVSNRAVDDQLARTFMSTFYKFLNNDSNVDHAFSETLRQLQSRQPGKDWDFFDLIH